MIPDYNPQPGSNVIVTFTDESEAVVYYWNGSWTVGVPEDPEDVELEPTAIVAWRYQ